MRILFEQYQKRFWDSLEHLCFSEFAMESPYLNKQLTLECSSCLEDPDVSTAGCLFIIGLLQVKKYRETIRPLCVTNLNCMLSDLLAS